MLHSKRVKITIAGKTYKRKIYTSSKGKYIIFGNTRFYILDNDYNLNIDNLSKFDKIISMDDWLKWRWVELLQY